MKKSLSWLLLTTALAAAPALAQEAPATPEVPDQDVEISAPGASGIAGDDIVVIGRMIPNVIRATPSVVSVLSQADIERTGEGDIAGALQRVTGLSVVGGRYVYVRGLGERYSAALLNGLPLPSPEPLKRVVPLDIFPTSVIASSMVQKSFVPSFPGEFGGGVINLTTRAVPEEGFLEVGGSVGGNTLTTGQLGYTHYGSSSDWTGFDSGARSIPLALKGAMGTGNRVALGEHFTLDQMKQISGSLVNAPTTLIQRNGTIPADMSLGLTMGDSWDVGEGRLGLVLAGNWSNSWETQGGVRQIAAGRSLVDGQEVLRANQDFRFLGTDNRIVVNGLLGVGYEFGEHRLRFTNLFVRDTLKESRIEEGINEINVSGEDRVNRNFTSWTERQLFTTQLVGEFRFGDVTVNARGTYANSRRDAPYEREISYRWSDEYQGFFNDLTTNGAYSRIAFSTLSDDVWAGALDLGYRLPTARPVSVSVGYAYSDNSRSSERRDFRHVTGGGVALPAAVAQTRPDYLLSRFNTETYGIILQEVSGQQGAAAFDAGLRVHGAYGQIEAELLDGVRIVGGVRFEDGSQFVSPVGLFGLPPLERTEIKKQYWLPGATLTWNFAEDMQLRFAASQTVARPQFRELAPQGYRDTDTDRLAYGNPWLVDSRLTNAEVRYEWFTGTDQRVALGAFWKKIDNPIETVPFEVGGTFGQTFANAPEAQLYGIEGEVVHYVPLDALGGLFDARRLLLSANYSWTKSELKVSDGDTLINSAGNVVSAANLFRDGQTMTGQSEHVGNLQIGFSHADRLSEQTLMLNYASDRATQRGPSNTPDYIERPGLQLDLVLREEIELGVPIEVKLEARNITGTRYREFQTLNNSSIDINRYRRGTSFALGMTAKF